MGVRWGGGEEAGSGRAAGKIGGREGRAREEQEAGRAAPHGTRGSSLSLRATRGARTQARGTRGQEQRGTPRAGRQWRPGSP